MKMIVHHHHLYPCYIVSHLLHHLHHFLQQKISQEAAPPPTPKTKTKETSTIGRLNIITTKYSIIKHIGFTTPLVQLDSSSNFMSFSFPQYTTNVWIPQQIKQILQHIMETTDNEINTNTDTETICGGVDKNHITTSELPMEYDVLNEPQYEYNNHKGY